MKALVISVVAGAALCSLIPVPASGMPMSNLAAAASELAVGQSVRYYRRYGYGYRSYYSYGYRPSYYSYGYRPSYYGYGYRPSYYSYGYRPSYYGYGPSSPFYP